MVGNAVDIMGGRGYPRPRGLHVDGRWVSSSFFFREEEPWKEKNDLCLSYFSHPVWCGLQNLYEQAGEPCQAPRQSHSRSKKFQAETRASKMRGRIHSVISVASQPTGQ